MPKDSGNRRELKWTDAQLVTTQLTTRNVSPNDSFNATFLEGIEPVTLQFQQRTDTWHVLRGLSAHPPADSMI